MDSNIIGKFIYTLRKEKNLSQYQLADMIPISRQAVSKWERGVTIPDSSTLLRLSEIFDVTINELLNGKRLQDNSIEKLESTTLEIIDQHNNKKKKDKRTIIVLITVIFFLSFSFLLYYFITSYNSIKVYKVGGTNEEIDLYNGLFIVTNEKAYLKLGKINNRGEELKKISLYYTKKNEKKTISYDIDIDEMIIIYSGYEESASIEDIKYILKNTYIEIETNSNKNEIIHLIFERDFINNDIFYSKKHKLEEKTEKNINNESNKINSKEVINIIKTRGKKKEGNFQYKIDNNNLKIEYWFYQDIELIRIIIKKEYIDYYFNTDYTICKYNKNITGEECNLELKKYYKILLNNKGT